MSENAGELGTYDEITDHIARFLSVHTTKLLHSKPSKPESVPESTLCIRLPSGMSVNIDPRKFDVGDIVMTENKTYRVESVMGPDNADIPPLDGETLAEYRERTMTSDKYREKKPVKWGSDTTAECEAGIHRDGYRVINGPKVNFGNSQEDPYKSGMAIWATEKMKALDDEQKRKNEKEYLMMREYEEEKILAGKLAGPECYGMSGKLLGSSPVVNLSPDQRIAQLHYQLGMAQGQLDKMTAQYAEAMKLLSAQNSDAPSKFDNPYPEYHEMRAEIDGLKQLVAAHETASRIHSRTYTEMSQQLERAESMAGKIDFMAACLHDAEKQLGAVAMEKIWANNAYMTKDKP